MIERKALDLLAHHGYHEVITYSFTSPKSSDLLGLPPNDVRRKHLRILNPLTEDFSVLRTSLIPGLLETACYNLSWKNSNLKLFELKRVFLPQEGEKLPKEIKYLAGLAIGMERDPHWAVASRTIDFYDVKGCVEDLLEKLQIKGITFQKGRGYPLPSSRESIQDPRGERGFGYFGGSPSSSIKPL